MTRFLQHPTSHRLASGAAFLLFSFLAACGGPDAKSANPTRSLDERRAVQIIARAFQDEQDTPSGARNIDLGGGSMLEVDVTSQGKKYGVAYVTPQEKQQLKGALPPRGPELGDALQLVHGTGDDANAKILVLYDSDYVYDDQVGTQHEETTITAENKLARDVRDFLVRAHAEKWP